MVSAACVVQVDGQFGGNAETRLQYLMQQSEVFTHFLDRYVRDTIHLSPVKN